MNSVETPRQLLGPNFVIGFGIAPLALWAAVFAWALLRERNIGEGIYLILIGGVVAYVVTMLICGAGFLWADRVVRTANIDQPRSTQILVKVIAGILLLPWVVIPIAAAIWPGK